MLSVFSCTKRFAHRLDGQMRGRLTVLTILTIFGTMKSETVGTLEAKTRFSELLGKVQRGWRFRITRHGRAIAELAPVPASHRPRPGFAKGCFVDVADDFDAALADFRDYSS